MLLNDCESDNYYISGREIEYLTTEDSRYWQFIADDVKALEDGEAVILCFYNTGEILTLEEATFNSQEYNVMFYRMFPMDEIVKFYYKKGEFGDIEWGYGEKIPEGYTEVGVKGL